MKARDLGKAQKIVADRNTATEAARALASGDAITVSVGKLSLVLAPDAEMRLRQQLTADCNAIITDATARLGELGIED